jgi:hypothetical protein
VKLDVTEKYSVKEEGESSNPSSVPPQIKQELEPESQQLLPPTAAAAQEEAGTAALKQPREFSFLTVLRIHDILVWIRIRIPDPCL